MDRPPEKTRPDTLLTRTRRHTHNRREPYLPLCLPDRGPSAPLSPVELARLGKPIAAATVEEFIRAQGASVCWGGYGPAARGGIRGCADGHHDLRQHQIVALALLEPGAGGTGRRPSGGEQELGERGIEGLHAEMDGAGSAEQGELRGGRHGAVRCAREHAATGLSSEAICGREEGRARGQRLRAPQNHTEGLGRRW